MTESEAQLILGVTASADTDAIFEAYEEAVFEQASFFMRRVFIPKLAKARIIKLDKVQEAAHVLGIKISKEKVVDLTYSFEKLDGHPSVLKEYNQAEMKIKLRLANTSSSAEAIALYDSWIQLFNRYTDAFLSFCSGKGSGGSAMLSSAPIFVEFQSASEKERLELIRDECDRLKKLRT